MDWTKMRILVTGATGLLGNNIVRQLLEEDHKIRALVRASSDPRPLQGLPVETVEADLRDARPLADAEAVNVPSSKAARVSIDRVRVPGTTSWAR